MAYLKSLEPDLCQFPGCEKRQKKQLVGNRNEMLGCYCNEHAPMKLRERELYESGATSRAAASLPGLGGRSF